MGGPHVLEQGGARQAADSTAAQLRATLIGSDGGASEEPQGGRHGRLPCCC